MSNISKAFQDRKGIYIFAMDRGSHLRISVKYSSVKRKLHGFTRNIISLSITEIHMQCRLQSDPIVDAKRKYHIHFHELYNRDIRVNCLTI